MDNLREMLTSLNKEVGSEEKTIEEAQAELQKLFKEYKAAGGECPDADAFVKDVVGFVRAKEFTGADIAEWDKTEGPESE